MANKIYGEEPGKIIEELNKNDKAGDILEIIISGALSIGSTFIIDKAVKKIYTPTNLGEKILTYLGTAALGVAVEGSIQKTVHDICHPFEEAKKQALVNNLLVTSTGSNDLAKEAIDLVRANQELTNTMLSAFVIPDDISTDDLNTVNDIMKNTDISVEDTKDE
jgi:hypothetical protein